MIVKSQSPGTTSMTFVLRDDALAILRQRAEKYGQSLDSAVTDLILESAVEGNEPYRRVVNRILLLPRSAERAPVTLELVNELRDEYP